MRNFFCAFFLVFVFSLYAQDAGIHNPEDTSGLVESSEAEQVLQN